MKRCFKNVLGYALVDPIRDVCEEIYEYICTLEASEPNHDDFIRNWTNKERCTEFMNVKQCMCFCLFPALQLYVH